MGTALYLKHFLKKYFYNYFIRNKYSDTKKNKIIPEVAIESILKHPETRNSFKLFDELKDWNYIEG